jgi:hypothetical protein
LKSFAVTSAATSLNRAERSTNRLVGRYWLRVVRLPGDATAYAHRQAELMFVTTTAGSEPAVEAARPALEAIWGKLAPHVNGAYANFLASATEEDIAAIYPTQTYQRLAAIKRRYDPGNLFTRNHNIQPQ